MFEPALSDYQKDSLIHFIRQYIKQVKSLNTTITELRTTKTANESKIQTFERNMQELNDQIKAYTQHSERQQEQISKLMQEVDEAGKINNALHHKTKILEEES